MKTIFFCLLVCLAAGCEVNGKTRQTSDGAKKRVLILCTGNSCRSQMAEAWWNHLGGGRWEAFSAGTNPKSEVYPLAVRAMAEKGIDMSGARPKSLDRFKREHFDLVITVCDDAERACPNFGNADEHLHWPFDDPPRAQGTDEQRMEVCRRVRDEIEAKIAGYLKGK